MPGPNHHRGSRGRLLVTVMASLFLAASVPGATGGVASAQEPGDVPSLALPEEHELVAAVALPVDDEPPTLPEELTVDDVISGALAALDELAPVDWEVDALAASLGSDPEAAFRFVRDAIRFDPYPGVLRGASGTLSARAGNSFDRAMLLESLLDGMGLTTRFALAHLDPASAAAIVTRGLDEPSVTLSDAAGHLVAPAVAAGIEARARRDYSLLRQALGDRFDALANGPADDAERDVVRHAWVQVEQDGRWTDLDPSMPDAQPGSTLVPATLTADSIPDADRQWLTLRVIAETLERDEVFESIALPPRLEPADASNAQILLTFQPDAGTSGGGLLGGSGRPSAFIPVLTIDGLEQPGAAFPVPGSGGGGLSLGGGPSVELLSLRISFTSEAPGYLPISHDRILVDRVPPDLRDAGTVIRSQLRTLPSDFSGPHVLGHIHHVMVSVGGFSPRASAVDRGDAAVFSVDELSTERSIDEYPLAALVWPMTVSDEALVLVSERVVVPSGDAETGSRAYVARPRVFIVTVGPDPAEPSQVMVETDLTIDGISLLVPDQASPVTRARRHLWYGALQTALETEFGLSGAAVLEANGRRLVGVSLFMTEPLTVLDAMDAAGLPASTPRTLRLALEQGRSVLVPGDPASAVAWWTVDPADGGVRSVLDPDLGGFLSTGPPLTPGELKRALEKTWPGRGSFTITFPKKCSGGTEYTTLEQCVATHSLTEFEVAYIKKYIHLMRAFAQWLVLG